MVIVFGLRLFKTFNFARNMTLVLIMVDEVIMKHRRERTVTPRVLIDDDW